MSLSSNVFLRLLMPPYEYDETSVQAQAGGELFEASGRHTVSLGWRSVGRDLDAEEMEKDSVCADGLETLTKGSTLDISDIRLRQGETKPPAPMTEAGLLSAMEHPAGYMDHEDSSLAKSLGETGGLGTVATRADIIEKLIDTGMIEKRDKYLYLTSKGRQVISWLLRNCVRRN